MPFIIGLIIVAVIIYFAFVRNPNDTNEQAVRKIAQTVVVIFVLAVIAAIIFLR